MLIKYRNDTRYSLDGVVTHDRYSSRESRLQSPFWFTLPTSIAISSFLALPSQTAALPYPQPAPCNNAHRDLNPHPPQAELGSRSLHAPG